jgi:HEAT repeat protein
MANRNMNPHAHQADDADADDNMPERKSLIKNQIQQYKHAEKPDLMTTLNTIQEGEKTGSPKAAAFYGLSGLSIAEIEQIAPEWQTLEVEYRRKLVRRLAEASETNYELDYRNIGLFATYDSDATVREIGIDVLWEDESIEVMDRFVELAKHDESDSVRAAALKALGRFILKGELGELPESETIRAQQAAVATLNDAHEPVEVRRRALEAISNSSHEQVPGAIQRAYRGDDRAMKLSAVYAMGRSCDDRWESAVINELDSSDDEMRYEATRAAGELELVAAVAKLGQLVAEDDAEIQDMAVWSLGEIGGREALRILRAVLDMAEENEDDDLVNAVEDAIGNASLAGGDMFGDFDADELN